MTGGPPPGEPTAGGTARDADVPDEHVVAELDRDLRAAEAEHRRLLAENRRLRRQVDEATTRLEAVYASETFRLGRAVLAGPRRLARWVEARRTGDAKVVSSRRFVAPGAANQVGAADPTQVARYRRVVVDGLPPADGGRTVAFAVSTDDLTRGRGDVFAAAGLGLALHERGWGVRLLVPGSWDDLDGVDVLVAMLAEPSLGLDPTLVPSRVRTVAWVRNNVPTWRSRGVWLHDVVLASSERTAEVLAEGLGSAVPVLPIGVDTALFVPGDVERHGVVATTNQFSADAPRPTFTALEHTGVTFPLALHGVHRGLPAVLEPYAAGPVDHLALPRLYGSSLLVLDDRQGPNRTHGNVNARVFEALACGALPVCDTDIGLHELGLGDVPSWSAADELTSTVEALLADPDTTARRAARLRSVVQQRHGWDRRAERFEQLLDPAPVASEPRPSGVLVVQAPDYRATNPYQDLLHAELTAPDWVSTTTDVDRLTAPRPRMSGQPHVLHLHWTAPVLGPAADARDARRRADRFLAGLDAAGDRGARLVWTVHNALPHDAAHPAVELELRQAIADRATLVHVMCDDTPAAIAPVRLDPARTVTVPHGAYVDVHADQLDRAAARRRLGLASSSTVVLALGQVRPYKGLDELLDAWDAAGAAAQGAELVVAGQPVNHPGVAELRERADHAAGVHLHLGRVDDDDLQVFLGAADVAVLPHVRALNSGLVGLAHAFGLAVIAPRRGCLPAHVAPGASRVHEPGALAGALADLGDLRTTAVRRAAREHAEAYTCWDMARDFRAALDEVVKDRRDAPS